MDHRAPQPPPGYDPADYPPFAVTVDLTIFTIRDGALKVLLVQRDQDPYAGSWALPGGFVEVSEDIEAAAWRELAEETNLPQFSGHLEQLRTYGAPGRDPRMRVVSVAYVAFAPNLPDPVAGSDARVARWWDVDDVVPTAEAGQDGVVPLAFDHLTIVTHGLDRVAAKLEYTSLATKFCADEFTLTELRRVYESVWGVVLDQSNFRRWVERTQGLVTPVEGARQRTGGRPASLYHANLHVGTLHPPLRRPDGARRYAPEV